MKVLQSEIERVADTLRNWPRGSSGHTAIYWNRETGEMFTRDHHGDTWTEFDDPAIVYVHTTDRRIGADTLEYIMQGVINDQMEAEKYRG
jgi:hypothetical protein